MKNHRLWIFLFVISAAAFALTPLLARHAAQTIAAREQTLVREKEKLTAQIALWREDMRQAEALSRTIGAADVARFLACGDRNALAATLEPLAVTARLDAFRYALEPAVPWAGSSAFPNLGGLAQSRLTFEAQAPHDGDVFAFLGALSGLPGRLEVEEVVLERLSATGLGASNLRVKGSLLWIANAAGGRS